MYVNISNGKFRRQNIIIDVLNESSLYFYY